MQDRQLYCLRYIISETWVYASDDVYKFYIINKSCRGRSRCRRQCCALDSTTQSLYIYMSTAHREQHGSPVRASCCCCEPLARTHGTRLGLRCALPARAPTPERRRRPLSLSLFFSSLAPLSLSFSSLQREYIVWP